MTAKTKRVCIFCGGYPVTREHLWPQWIGQILRELTSTPFAATLEKPGEAPRSWEAFKIDVTAAHVCGRCNSTWMADLENNTKPILQPMMLGQARITTLTPEQQTILARWAFKTALIADYALPVPPSDRRFPSEWYKHFYQHQLPPVEGVKIWTTAYIDAQKAAHVDRHTLLIGPRSVPNDDTSAGHNTHAILSTTTVFRAVFQVLGYFGGAWRPPRDGANGTLEFLLRLWPNAGIAVEWPRNSIALDNKTFVAFKDRLDFMGP